MLSYILDAGRSIWPPVCLILPIGAIRLNLSYSGDAGMITRRQIHRGFILPSM
jgi:hypothetical protein